jgi:hypothetical protein
MGLILAASTSPLLFAQDAPKPISTSIKNRAASDTNNYWTPDRLASAVPRDLLDGNSVAPGIAGPLSGGPEVSSDGQPPQIGPLARALAARRKSSASPRAVRNLSSRASAGIDLQGYNYAYPFTSYNVESFLYDESLGFVDYPQSTIGKLFFTLGGLDFVCSASVLRPHILLTARHCVFDTANGLFATNVVFYPGWHSGPNASLSGAWFARNLATWNGGGLNYDIGMIQTFDDDAAGCGGSLGGNPIENVTGYLGYFYGGDYSQVHWDEFGYPQAPPYNGNLMVQSESSTGALAQFGQTDTVEVGNPMTGGSSGGPWIRNFGPGGGGNNWANGLNSFKFTNPDRSLAMNSPQFFDYNFNQLLIYIQGFSCP